MIDDVEAAITFYTTHLGFTLDSSSAPAFAALTRGPLRLLLSGKTSSGARAMPDGRQPVPGGWTAFNCQWPTSPPRSPGCAPPGCGSAMTS